MGTKHKVDYKRSGNAITPVCSCGWSGETVGPGHREWDRQFESVVAQGKAHAKAASQKASSEVNECTEPQANPFTPGYLLQSLSDLELPEQVAIIEKHIEEHGLHQGADVISMLMLNILLELDGGKYSDELKQRVKSLITKVREFNEARFK